MAKDQPTHAVSYLVKDRKGEFHDVLDVTKIDIDENGLVMLFSTAAGRFEILPKAVFYKPAAIISKSERGPAPREEPIKKGL